MQDITVRNKEIRFRSDRIVVESENRAEKIRFTVTEASSIEGLSGMAFYMQYRNRLGEVGMDNLVKSTEGDNLYLDWLPSASFTKESGVVEVQIIGFTQSLVLTEDLTFQSGKLYFTSEGAYIPVYPATSSESPKVGQSISGSVYENEETLSDHRWSSQKAVLILPEDVFQGGTPVYTETQVKSLITEIATQLALAEDAADTASAAALAAQSYKTDAETARTQAQNRASAAEASKDKAEDWASKFNDANPSATQPVEDENYSAKKYAYDANVSEAEATEQRLIAEGYAVGEQHGTPVGPLSPYFQNNAKFFYQSVQDTNLTKADKVDQATAGDLAGLDAHGNLTDSGIAASNVIKKTDVVNSTSSDSETLPLSAKMGKQLQTQIDSLGGRGRFLSLWNSIYGLPMTEPESSPYTYRSGDYYIVSKTVETELALADDYSSSATYALGDLVKHNGTLYECTTAIPEAEEWTAAHWTAAADHKPAGTSYTSGVRSTTLETEEVAPGDYYEFDGSVWTLFVNTVTYAQIKGDPHDSAALDAELDKKYEKPSTGIPETDLAGAVQTSLGKADSAYQMPGTGVPYADLASDVQMSLDKADSALQQHQDISGKADKESASAEGYLAKFNAGGNPVNSSILAEDVSEVVSLNEGTPENKSNVSVVPSDSDGFAKVKKIVGKSRAWNQLVNPSNIQGFSQYGITVTDNNDGTISVTGTGSVTTSVSVTINGISLVSGHKYFLPYNDDNARIYNGATYDQIFTAPATLINIYFLVQDQKTYNCTFPVMLYDLTLIFGSGNEPSTVADALSLIPSLGQYKPYDAGSLVSTEVSGVKSVGVNIWDEVAESGGISSQDGISYPDAALGRSKNYIPVKPNTAYYAKTSQIMYLRFYDENKGYIGYGAGSVMNGSFTTPQGCYYMRFVCDTAIADNSIQICLNSYADKTTYHPYKTDTISLSETVTLRSAGSVSDELDVESGVVTRNIGSVDLGSLSWNYSDGTTPVFFAQIEGMGKWQSGTYPNILCEKYGDRTVANSLSNLKSGRLGNGAYTTIDNNNFVAIRDTAYSDTTTFASAMSGVYLAYELATPTTESIDPVSNVLETETGGTIRLIHEETPQIDDSYSICYPNKIRARLDRAEGNIENLQSEIVTKYVKPSAGIPTTDLADKANVAIIPYLEAKVNQRTFDPEFTVNYPSPIYGRGNIPTGLGIARWAEIPTIKGKSRAWNQMVKTLKATNPSQYGIAWTNNGDGSLTISGTPTTTAVTIVLEYAETVVGHKILIFGGKSNARLRGSNSRLYANCDAGQGIIVDAGSVDEASLAIVFGDTTTAISYTIRPICRDLTLIFGAGNEPSTVAEAIAQIPDLLKYDAYNAGSLVDTEISGVKSVGVNRWDEEWELGAIDNKGIPISASTIIRSKNYIPLVPNTEYMIHRDTRDMFYVFLYDANKNFVRNVQRITDDYSSDSKFTTASNEVYMKFHVVGTSYNNDIQISRINGSVSTLNTTYHPYKSDTLSLPEPVTLRSAGSVADELDVESGVVTRKAKEFILTNNFSLNGDLSDKIYITAPVSDSVSVPNSDTSIRVISDKFCGISANEAIDGTILYCIALISSNRIYICVPKSDFADVSAFNTWISQNTVKVVYEIPESTESIDPVPDPFLEVEEGGSIELVHEETPAIDDAFDVGYLIV